MQLPPVSIQPSTLALAKPRRSDAVKPRPDAHAAKPRTEPASPAPAKPSRHKTAKRATQPKPATAKAREIAPGVRMEQLKNGVTLITRVRKDAADTKLSIATAAGGYQDPKGKHGAAHLFEHMAFEGTPTRSGKQIRREMVELGGQANAYTSLDQIRFINTVASHDARAAADLMVDQYLHPNSDPDKLRKQQAIVKQEMRYSYADRGSQASLERQRLLYGKQATARGPIGTRASVSRIKPEDVREYHRKYFTGVNTVAYVDGDPNGEAAALFRKKLAALPRGERVKDPAYKGFAKGAKIERIPFGKADAATTLSVDLPNNTSTGIAGMLVGEILARRLNERLREKSRRTYGVGAGTLQGDTGAGQIVRVSTNIRPKYVRAAAKEIAKQVTNLPTDVTDEEIASAKRSMGNQFAMQPSDPGQAAEQAVESVLAGTAVEASPSNQDIAKMVQEVPNAHIRLAARVLGRFDHAKVMLTGNVVDADEVRRGLRDGGAKVKLTEVKFDADRYRELVDEGPATEPTDIPTHGLPAMALPVGANPLRHLRNDERDD